MIIGERFVWLHLPKTGGTTMNRLFRDQQLSGITVDSDDVSAKHDSIKLRVSQTNALFANKARFITMRRLEEWLISDWFHKRRHMNLPDLDFEPVKSGLFYSLRLGGVWVAADWWLRYFETSDQMHYLRLEYLIEDINAKLLPYLPEGTSPFRAVAKENRLPETMRGNIKLDSKDIDTISHTNPIWSKLQQQLYTHSQSNP